MGLVTAEKLAIGNRIKEKREALGYNKQQLSRLVGGSDSLVYNYEKGSSSPSEDIIDKLAKELHTTVSYLQTGKEEIKPVNMKKAYSNHEGYFDPTAAKAVAIVMTSNASVKPGEVYAYVDGSQTVIILKVFGKRVLVAPVSGTSKSNGESVCAMRNGEDVYYVDLTYINSRDAQIIWDKANKKFTASEISMCVILSKLQKILGFTVAPVVTPPDPTPIAEPAEPDEMSIIFSEALSYFKDKNGLEVKIPEGVVSLQQAMDISKSTGISLTELTKDHTEDKILDEICKYEEKIKELKAKIGM